MSEVRKETSLDNAFVGDVVRRLVAKLDDLSEPFIGIEHVTQERAEARDWLMFHCFSDDHALYDDVMALLSQTRRLTK